MPKYTKPSIGKHALQVPVNNPFNQFNQAYLFVRRNPNRIYTTVPTNRRKGIKFKAEADLAKSGKHKSQQMIRCKTQKSIVYIYDCCWNYQSNCSGTHINTYSEAIT
jgi:hypothetical protein